jgi:hypothetical protein
VVGTRLEDRVELRYLQGETLVREKEGTELKYAVVITDLGGKDVAVVQWPSAPRKGGEPVKYLPIWPQVNMPRSSYSYTSHIIAAGFPIAFGALAAFSARWCAKKSEQAPVVLPSSAVGR